MEREIYMWSDYKCFQISFQVCLDALKYWLITNFLYFRWILRTCKRKLICFFWRDSLHIWKTCKAANSLWSPLADVSAEGTMLRSTWVGLYIANQIWPLWMGDGGLLTQLLMLSPNPYIENSFSNPSPPPPPKVGTRIPPTHPAHWEFGIFELGNKRLKVSQQQFPPPGLVMRGDHLRPQCGGCLVCSGIFVTRTNIF